MKIFTHDHCGPVGNEFAVYRGDTGDYVSTVTGCLDSEGISKTISELQKIGITVTVLEVQQEIYRHEKYHLPETSPVHSIPGLKY